MSEGSCDGRRKVLGALVVLGLVALAVFGPRPNRDDPSEELRRRLANMRNSVLAYSDGGSLVVTTPDGSRRRALMPTPGVGSHVSPAWSPDGERLAFIYAPECNLLGQRTYQIVSDGSGLKLMHSGFCGKKNPTPLSGASCQDSTAPQHRCPAEGIYLMKADGGEPTLLQADDKIWNGFGMDWSPDGRSLLYTSAGCLCLLHPADSDPTPITLTHARGGDFSPDLDPAPGFQGYLTFQSLPHDIVVARMEIPEHGPPQLDRPFHELRRPGVQDAPVFAPDGRHIAFLEGARASQHRSLHVMRVSLGPDDSVTFGKPRCILRDKPLRGLISWSPDSHCLTIGQGDSTLGFGKAVRLCHVTLDGRTVTLSPKGYSRMAATPAWSPAWHPQLVRRWSGGPIRQARLR